MFQKRSTEQQARVRVLSKTPAGMPYIPGSSITPSLPQPDKLFRVVLRFDPPREHYHPDDNDLELSCTPELYQTLTVGMHGVATWQGKRLLNFVVCD